MNNEKKGVTIEMMGQSYQIKCPDNDVELLQRAAAYVEEKMRNLRDSGNVLSADRIAAMVALNTAHQFLSLEEKYDQHMDMMQKRMYEIQNKVDSALERRAQMELSPAE